VSGGKGTKEELEADLVDICQRYNLVAVYAFGSRAEEIAGRVRGESVTATSSDADVDVGVLPVLGREIGVRAQVDLMQALEDLFDVARVDLVFLREADPFVAANIVRGERLYARDSYSADEYDLYVLRRAGDLAPLERERMALILGEER
jgi:predicted nucleotidyltransferase